MVRIRLKRLGRKHRPFYRIVAIDNHARRQGAPLEELGYYNPMSKILKLDKAAAQAWIAKGAQPSERVIWLLEKANDTNEEMVLQINKKATVSRKASEKAKAAQAS
jgi:small subunit ribosomal protein S16